MYYYKDIASTAGLTDLRVNSTFALSITPLLSDD